MSIRFSCTECGTHLKVSDEKAGSSGKCPTCGSAIVVPELEVTEPVETASLVAAADPPDPWLTDDPESFGETVEEALPPRRKSRRRGSTGTAPHDYRAAPTLTIVTAVLIGAILVLDLGLWIVSIAQFAEMQNGPADQLVDEMPLTVTDLALLGLFVIRLPTFIACAVCFLIWTHRANTNAAAIAGRPLEISPGWSVGFYFIPFANLIKPYQSMKEIWLASSHNNASTGLVSLWWGLWIFSGIANQISMRLGFAADTVEKMRASALLDIGVGLVDLPLSVVAILLVRRVFAMQESASRSGRSGSL